MRYTAGEMKDRFLFLNRYGSIMKAVGEDGVPLFTTMIDSFTPEGDDGDAMLVFWKEVGYQNGPQFSHTGRFTSIEVDDSLEDKHDGEQWLIIDMEDEKGRKYHVEMLDKVTNADECEKWKKWTKYKAKNAALFAKIDQAMLDQ